MNRHDTLVNAFLSACETHATAVAVVDGDRELTYRDLSDLSESAARLLIDAGVKPGDAVALSLPRSLELGVAIWAILRAGATYVPLDADAPAEQQRHCASVGECLVLISHTDIVELEDLTRLPASALVQQASACSVLPEPHPDTLACLMFTSGSTGTPKAVEVTQAGILRTTYDPDYINLTPGTRLANLANPTFDALTFELFGALLNGGTLIVVGSDDLLETDRLANRLVDQGVDTLFLTAALFHTLADLSPQALAGCRDVLVGGEPLRPAILARFFDATPNRRCRLYNAYGPTECTTFATLYAIDPADMADHLATERIPIGFAIDDTRTRVLDEAQRPVPMGRPGELYLGGTGVARGYRGDAEATRQRFHRLADTQDTRWYATGDRVRQRPDGALDCLGRDDGQVKIRGHRVELTAIEQILCRHPSVRDAAVHTVDTGISAQLVASVITSSDALDATELRSHLARHVPSYMVPGRYRRLERLPRSANGKLDRSRLAAMNGHDLPRRAGIESSDPTHSPALSAVLAESKHLLNAPVSATDGFLDLGGDSLLAMQLLGRLAHRHALVGTVGALIDAPTLADFAGTLTHHASPSPSFDPMAPYPASAEQARMVYLQELAPAHRAYNAHFVYRVDGDIDSDRLEQAVVQALHRHPALLTRFERRSDGVWAIPDATQQPTLLVADSPDEAMTHCDGPFDLSSGPLVRLALITDNGKPHRLHLCIHHIAIDGHSVNRLLTDISDAYTALDRGQPGPPPETVGYAVFAHHRERFLSSELADVQRQYWRDRMHQARQQGHGPVFDPSPSMALAGRVLRERTGPGVWTDLNDTASALSITAFSALTALFGWALAKVTGRTELTLATPVANRNLGDFEDLCGLCVNTVPLFVPVHMNRALNEHLRAVHAAVTELFRHSDLDYDTLVGLWSDTGERDGLADVMVVLENTRPERLQLAGARLKPEPCHNGTAKFPMTLFVTPQQDGSASLELEYAPDSVTDAQARAVLHLMMTSLGHQADAQEALLTALPVAMSDLIQDTPPDHPTPAISSPLAAWHTQVDRCATAPAVGYRDRWLSYGDANAAANAVAGRLTAAGIMPGDRVGLCIRRSLELLPALLGVWKAGAVYVPLDPDYPASRLAYMIEDSGLSCILTEDNTRPFLADTSVPVLTVTMNECLDGSRDRGPAISDDPDRCAYMLYTSGSTGMPKGVMISLRSLAHYLGHAVDRYGALTSHSLVSSSLNFDATITTLLTPLMMGGQVELLVQDGQEVPALARALASASGPRLLKITPTHLWALREYLDTSADQQAHVFVVGGEAFGSDLALEYRRRFPNAEFVNEYGPTETVVGCMEYWLPHDPAEIDRERDLPIGRPIAGTRLRVLEAWGGACPAGVEGELYIGGPGVGLGYHQRPELTRQRFQRLDGGERFYASGDRVTVSSDGLLHYHGRHDDQLKIRGHRIEAGEIDAQLRALPNVSQAACALKPGPSGDDILVGYLVVEAGSRLVENARQRLASVLPAAAVPERLITVEALPHTPNGKLDRDALPAPESLVPRETASAAEKLIGQVEAEVATLLLDDLDTLLGCRIDPELHFFEAGLNSLLLLKWHARLTTEHGFSLELVDFFSHPTIRALSAFLSDQIADADTDDRPDAIDSTESAEDGIAIIGMAVRVPGADNLSDFWSAVSHGQSGIEYGGDGISPGRVAAVASMNGLFDFDPGYFGLSPADAEWMDPQQRHMLMGAVHALENAGLAPGAIDALVGVAVSSSENRYQQSLLRAGATASADPFQLSLLNEKDFVSSRLAYHLNLRGPSLTVQSACSSSLAAIHVACQQLRNGDCDIALAGGVSADPDLLAGYEYRPGRIFSHDGHCRAFGAESDGTVPANGLGLVVLKPLTRARADGDRIYAVIEGSALANDGHDKVSYTAPSVDGQAQVIRQALSRARITPEQVGYLEAHGTGTELGDPIEIEALTRAFGLSPDQPAGCALATVKSQVGHLASAAGVVGLIRAALGVYHGIRPANLDSHTPNPAIAFERTPFFLNAHVTAWPETERWAGVSSFGMGGTNAHLIIRNDLSTRSTIDPAGSPVFLGLSARTPTDLEALKAQVEQVLMAADMPLTTLADLLARTKSHYPHRYGLWVQSAEEALMKLADGGGDQEQTDLLRDWLSGGNWPATDQQRQALPLDTLPYPFALTPYRVTPSPQSPNPDSPLLRRSHERWLYTPTWQAQRRLPHQASPWQGERWILDDSAGWAEALQARSMTLSEAREAIGPIDSSGALELILSRVDATRDGLASAITLLKSWMRHHPGQPVTLTVLTQDAVTVSPESAPDPYAAELQGLIQVAPIEAPAVTVRWVDVPLQARISDDLPRLWTALGDQAGQWVLRQGRLWQPRLLPFEVTDTPHEAVEADAVILVIGGHGGVGRAVLDHFATQPGVTLISLSRSGHDTDWDAATPRALGQAGFYDLAGDIANVEEVAHLADWIGHRHGHLTGLVHAAGIPGQGVIAQLDEERLTVGLAAKRAGLALIERHLLPLAPRWCVIMSSLSAQIGVAGQTDYAAAHAHADAWVYRQMARQENRTDVMSINWPTWHGTGMAAQGDDIEDPVLAGLALEPAEALTILRTALRLGVPRLVVSPIDMATVEAHFRSLARNTVTENTASTNPDDDIVDRAFRQVLGVNEVSEDDDFQSLGGDSLTALDILDQLEPTFPGRLDLGTLLELGTPAAIRAYLTGAETEMPESAPSDRPGPVTLRDGDGPGVLVIPPVGGDLIGYRNLVEALPEGQAIRGVRDPILANESDSERTVERLSRRYLNDLGEVDGTVIVGWSFGALVAWELVRQCEAAGQSPAGLVLIDPPSVGPDIVPAEPGAILAQELAMLTPDQPPHPVEQNDSDYRQRLSRACDANARAMRTFQPDGQVETATTLVIALESEPERPGAESVADMRRMWQSLVRPPLRAVSVAADHYSIMNDRHARQLSHLITESLVRSTALETPL